MKLYTINYNSAFIAENRTYDVIKDIWHGSTCRLLQIKTIKYKRDIESGLLNDFYKEQNEKYILTL